MFGRRTKAALEAELLEAKESYTKLSAIHAGTERRLKMLVVESNFWKNQTVEYGNQIEFWQKKNRELLEQMIKESTDVDLRAYADSIKQAIIDARPEPSTIAAVIATADKDVQGAFSLPPRADHTVLLPPGGPAEIHRQKFGNLLEG